METYLKIVRLVPVVITLMFLTPACDTSVENPVSVPNRDKSAPSGSVELEKITVLALGPADGRAVVAQSEGKMLVLKVGDTVPETKAIVLQVLHDKLVVEDMIENPGEPPVKQVVWIFKPEKTGAKSRVQRLDQTGPEKNFLLKPTVMER